MKLRSRQFLGGVSWQRLLSFILMVVLMAILLSFANTSELISAASETDLTWYAIGGVVFFAGYVPATYRWMVLERTAGYELSPLAAFEVVSISYGLNKLLPANAGDLTRSRLMSRYHDVDSHTELTSLVAVERFVDVVAIVLLFTIASLVVTTKFVTATTYVVILLTGCLVVGALYFLGDVTELVEPVVPDRLYEELRIAVSTVQTLSKKTLVSVAFLTLARWGLAGFGFIFVAKAVHLGVGIGVGVMVITGIGLVSVLPLTPGGIGPGEGISLSILLTIGVSYPTAIVLTLLQRSLGVFWTALLGIAIYTNRFFNRGQSPD